MITFSPGIKQVLSKNFPQLSSKEALSTASAVKLKPLQQDTISFTAATKEEDSRHATIITSLLSDAENKVERVREWNPRFIKPDYTDQEVVRALKSEGLEDLNRILERTLKNGQLSDLKIPVEVFKKIGLENIEPISYDEKHYDQNYLINSYAYTLLGNIFNELDEKSQKEIENKTLSLVKNTYSLEDYTPKQLRMLRERSQRVLEAINTTPYPALDAIQEQAARVKENPSKENLKALFDKETEILRQELFEPQKYVERALKTNALGLKDYHPDQFEDLLQANAIDALTYHVYSMKKMGYDVDTQPFREKMIEFLTPSSNDPLSIRKKEEAATFLALNNKDMAAQEKEQLKQYFLTIYKTDPDADKRYDAFVQYITRLSDKEDRPFIGKELARHMADPTSPLQNQALYISGKMGVDSPELQQHIKELLNSPDTDFEAKRTAIWVCGENTTPANFDTLLQEYQKIEEASFEKEDNKEPALQKEMILSGLGEYIKADINAEKARTILEKEAAKTGLSAEIAEAVLEKVDKKEEQKDYYIHKFLGDDQEAIDHYLAQRDQLVSLEREVTPKELNFIDKSLLTARPVLEELLNLGKTIHIREEKMPTLSVQEAIGTRSDDGHFSDDAAGLVMKSSKDVGVPTIVRSGEQNIFAHELGHLTEDTIFIFGMRIGSYYESAQKNNAMVTDYSNVSPSEYYADGVEAYVSPAKDHFDLIDSLDSGQNSATKASLYTKDKELFDFIEVNFSHKKEIWEHD